MKKSSKREFRSKLSEKVMDLGNLVVAGLVIGQFISERTFSIELFIAGIAVTVICYFLSYLIYY